MFTIFVGDWVAFFQNTTPWVIRLYFDLFAISQPKPVSMPMRFDSFAVIHRQEECVGMFHEVPPAVVHLSVTGLPVPQHPPLAAPGQARSGLHKPERLYSPTKGLVQRKCSPAERILEELTNVSIQNTI